ncbi:hypothetical protein O181_056203 [Austropuccinia psidii MF-1]|uniref:Uncharacterized protein n=1 Tax=Austropuccinia psidii MF-1 TaxID=1389203 RepID=A0A9Q3HT77_9BASI|nr:hypothetical protein [Austropuccinia psidii MF-1]
MPSTRSGASYNSSRSPQKGYRYDYERIQSVLEGKGADSSTRSLSEHIQSKPEGIQQFNSTQIVSNPDRPLEKLNELLPSSEWSKNNPPPPKHVPKPTPVSRRSNSNVKRQPQAEEKGKAKEPATISYSQGYRIPKIQLDAMENLFQMARTMMEMKKREEARLKYKK